MLSIKMKRYLIWAILVVIAIFGFFSIYHLLLPGDVPYADIPLVAKVNTAAGVLGFFLASSGLGLLVATVSDASLKLMRRQRLQLSRLVVAVSVVGVGVLMVRYYWNWLATVTAVSGSP